MSDNTREPNARCPHCGHEFRNSPLKRTECPECDGIVIGRGTHTTT